MSTQERVNARSGFPPEYDRLAKLYEIGKVLANFQSIESTGQSVLAVVTGVLQVRTAVLVSEAQGLQRVFSWGAESLNPADLRLAEQHAWDAFVYLAGSKQSADNVVKSSSLLPGGVSQQRLGERRFITLPLSPSQGGVSGVFQIEGASAFDERDLLFVNAVADQLSIAIDRARLALENVELYGKALGAIRSRDVLLGIVSHDLKNPLNAIQLNLDSLVKSTWAEADPRHSKRIESMRRSANRMKHLIGDLSDIGSIEAGRLSVEMRRESATSIVNDAVDSVKLAAANKEIRLEKQLFGPDLLLSCDRERVMQVLSNLLGNAIKFTDQGGSIAVAVVQWAAQRACFSVTDTGTGIPESHLAHVFDRYWQASETVRFGTGLGLSIAKGIVEAHAGSIWVKSEVGIGSTFFFTVPLAPSS